MTGAAPSPIMEPIAIVGMSCLFPEAGSLQEYWDNICTGRDCITDVPASRWNPDEYYDPAPDSPDKTYCKRGGFIPDTEFDPLEFGLPPHILEVTDTSQLLSLVVAKRALEDAGYGPIGGRQFDRERTGVVLGVGGGQKLIQPLVARLQYPVWERVLRNSGLPDGDVERVVDTMKKAYIPWEENSFPGLLGNVIAGRIANRFDLGGINCVVDAACASSLAAVEMAVGELVNHRTDMVITGGVDTDNSIFMYMCFSKTPAFSRTERLRPFDAQSDGMMIGEGIGMVVLKRLSDAENDGDRIYALLKGIGSSSDGRYKSIYAPRSEGQARALRRAHEAAGVVPSSIGLIEAHGTGTVAGDLVEVTTLRQVFAGDAAPAPHVALGSVKSQIGHTKAAAGAAGLIKAALALHHKVLPPTINVTEPHPALGLTDSPLYLNTETRPWMPGEGEWRRRAGVSSFGFGGSNYHAVLEEYETEQAGAYRLQRIARPLVLAAPTPGELAVRCRDAAAAMGREDGVFQQLADQAAAGIPSSWARIGFTARSADEAVEKLRRSAEKLETGSGEEAWEEPRGLSYRRHGLELAGRVVVLFPGQGSQYLGMGSELAANVPEVRSTFRAMDHLFGEYGDPPLTGVVYPPPTFDRVVRKQQENRLRSTECAQPAIGVLSAALFNLLRESGFAPDFAAGHSFGELAALWAAGAMELDAFFALARARGRAMAPPPDPDFDAGTMLAVGAGAAVLQRELVSMPGVSLANLNAPDQSVLAGPRTAMERAAVELAARGHSVVPLPVSAAFHTPLVAHAEAPFREALSRVAFDRPRIPVFANSTGTAYPGDGGSIRATLAAQLLQPVRFQEQVENLYRAGGFLFVECGPGTVLTKLVRRILGTRPHVAIAVNGDPRSGDSDTQFREALVRLRVAGLPLTMTDPYGRRDVPVSPAAHRATTITLSGSNYVSEKTRRSFDDAMQNGQREAVTTQATTTASLAQPNPNLDPHREPAPDTAAPSYHPVATDSPALSPGSLAVAVEQFGRQQAETLRAHQQYLENEAEYIKSFQQIMQQQQQLLLAPDRATFPPGVLDSLSHSLQLFHQHQGETSQVHRQYLEYQANFAGSILALMQHGATQPADPAPCAVPSLPAPPISQTIPVPPVERVEAPPKHAEPPPSPANTRVVPAVQNDFGEMVAVRPAPIPERPPAPRPIPAVAPESPPVVPPTVPDSRTAVARPLGPSREQISAGLLEIVSEKTGYPVETLELEMDIEADLGIDSIKRVQILSATQDRFPDAPPLKAEDLAELRTLAEIVDYVSAQRPEPSYRAGPAGGGTAVPPVNEPSLGWVRQEPLPQPDWLDISFPAGYSCLVTDSGSGLTPALVRVLRSLGWPVVVLGLTTPLPGTRLFPPDVPRFEMADQDEVGTQEILNAITAERGAPGTLIHVGASEEGHVQNPGAGVLFGRAEEVIVRQVFLLAKHLQPSIISAARSGFGAFITVTRLDGELGTSGKGISHGMAESGLSGLVKTLSIEWPGVFCRSIDISPGVPDEEAAARVLAELHDPNRNSREIGLSAGGRTTLTTNPAMGRSGW